MAEYTIGSVVAVLLVVGLELAWFRTGMFKMKAFWIGYLIVLFFECLVDGWLTKLSSPVVIYNEKFDTGWRFPWDVPAEDFLFGFALISLGLMLWLKSDDQSDKDEA